MPRILPRVLKKRTRARPRARRRKLQEPSHEPQLLEAATLQQPPVPVHLPEYYDFKDDTTDSSETSSSVEFNDIEYLEEAFEEMTSDFPDQFNEYEDTEYTHNDAGETHPKKSESLSDQLKAGLAGWVSKYSIPLAAVSDLLKILKQYTGINLPSDARSLLKTPREINIRKICNGEYVHIGIAEFLNKFNLSECINDGSPIILSFSVDGTPVSKSGANDLWIISGAIHIEGFLRHVFIVGIFNGPSKPTSFNTFLNDFVDELYGLLENGFLKDGKLYNVNVKCFTADAPAVAYMKSIKSHGGYSACPKCETRGTNISRKIVYPEVDAPLRTDTNFRQRLSNNTNDDHHISLDHTVLEILPIDMIDDFVIDKMHAVDEGVCKKMLVAFTGKANPQKLSKRKQQDVDGRIKECAKYVPMEFQRKLRTLNYVAKMKATEFRNIVLYAGPVIFYQILPTNTFRHFLNFSIAVRILCSPALYQKYNTMAKKLLVSFVESYPELYGKDTVSFNVHILIHLADDSYKHGPLDSYSCYPFEAGIKKIKRYIHSQNKPLQQIFNRLQEETSFVNNFKSNSDNAVKLSHFEYNQRKFYRLIYPNFTVRADKISDNCIMWVSSNETFILRASYFEKINEDIFVTGQLFEVKESLCSSKLTRKLIMLLGNFETSEKTFPLHPTVSKMVCLPCNYNNCDFYVTPLIHTLL